MEMRAVSVTPPRAMYSLVNLLLPGVSVSLAALNLAGLCVD